MQSTTDTKTRIEKWEDNCQVFERNKKGMGFSAHCVEDNGFLKICISDLKPEYERFRVKLQKLIRSNTEGAIWLLSGLMNPTYTYSQVDYDKQLQVVKDHIKKHQQDYINAMLTSMDDFYNTVDSHASILRMRYMLSVVSFVDGNWQLPDHSVWTGEGWKDVNGIIRKGGSVDVWKAILGSKEIEKCPASVAIA